MSKKKIKNILKSSTAALLCLTVLITGFFAFLTSSDEADNVFTNGKVTIELLETFDGRTIKGNSRSVLSSTKVVPGQTVQKAPKIKNVGTHSAKVYLLVGIPVDYCTVVSASGVRSTSTNVWQEAFTLGTIDPAWTELGLYRTANDYNYYLYSYNSDLAVGSTTTELFSNVTLKNLLINDLNEFCETKTESKAVYYKKGTMGNLITSSDIILDGKAWYQISDDSDYFHSKFDGDYNPISTSGTNMLKELDRLNIVFENKGVFSYKSTDGTCAVSTLKDFSCSALTHIYISDSSGKKTEVMQYYSSPSIDSDGYKIETGLYISSEALVNDELVSVKTDGSVSSYAYSIPINAYAIQNTGINGSTPIEIFNKYFKYTVENPDNAEVAPVSSTPIIHFDGEGDLSNYYKVDNFYRINSDALESDDLEKIIIDWNNFGTSNGFSDHSSDINGIRFLDINDLSLPDLRTRTVKYSTLAYGFVSDNSATVSSQVCEENSPFVEYQIYDPAHTTVGDYDGNKVAPLYRNVTQEFTDCLGNRWLPGFYVYAPSENVPILTNEDTEYITEVHSMSFDYTYENFKDWSIINYDIPDGEKYVIHNVDTTYDLHVADVGSSIFRTETYPYNGTGFVLGSDGYYSSTNTEYGTCSMAQVTFNAGEKGGYLVVDYEKDEEGRAYLGAVDKTIGLSTTVNTVASIMDGSTSGSYNYGYFAKGKHVIFIKFYQGLDPSSQFKFKVSIANFSDVEVTTSDCNYYPFTLNSDGYYESTNAGIPNSRSETVFTINISSKCRLYAEYIYNAEGQCDPAYIKTEKYTSLIYESSTESKLKSLGEFSPGTVTVSAIYVKNDTIDVGNDSFKIKFLEYEADTILPADISIEPVPGTSVNSMIYNSASNQYTSEGVASSDDDWFLSKITFTAPEMPANTELCAAITYLNYAPDAKGIFIISQHALSSTNELDVNESKYSSSSSTTYKTIYRSWGSEHSNEEACLYVKYHKTSASGYFKFSVSFTLEQTAVATKVQTISESNDSIQEYDDDKFNYTNTNYSLSGGGYGVYKLSIYLPTKAPIYLNYITQSTKSNSSYANYRHLYISKVDVSNPFSNNDATESSSNIFKSANSNAGGSNCNMGTFSAGTHYIYVKFRRGAGENSSTHGLWAFCFKIFTDPTITTKTISTSIGSVVKPPESFTALGDGYFKNNNTGSGTSTSMANIKYTTTQANQVVHVNYIGIGEPSTYKLRILSDSNVTSSMGWDLSVNNSSQTKIFSISDPGEHYISIKVFRDATEENANNYVKFKIEVVNKGPFRQQANILSTRAGSHPSFTSNDGYLEFCNSAISKISFHSNGNNIYLTAECAGISGNFLYVSKPGATLALTYNNKENSDNILTTLSATSSEVSKTVLIGYFPEGDYTICVKAINYATGSAGGTVGSFKFKLIKEDT